MLISFKFTLLDSEIKQMTDCLKPFSFFLRALPCQFLFVDVRIMTCFNYQNTKPWSCSLDCQFSIWWLIAHRHHPKDPALDFCYPMVKKFLRKLSDGDRHKIPNSWTTNIIPRRFPHIHCTPYPTWYVLLLTSLPKVIFVTSLVILPHTANNSTYSTVLK